MNLLGLLTVGLVAGVCAGMFGIGGGLIIVPALIFIFFIRRYLFNMWGRVVR